ncbi:hypothetical protein [Nostoc sp.]
MGHGALGMGHWAWGMIISSSLPYSLISLTPSSLTQHSALSTH